MSRVLSDYSEFNAQMKSKERTKKFIDDNWQNYADSFDMKSADPSTQEMVIRLILLNVIRSRKVITEIKGKVKL